MTVWVRVNSPLVRVHFRDYTTIVSRDVPDFHSIKVHGVLHACIICEEIEHYFFVKSIIPQITKVLLGMNCWYHLFCSVAICNALHSISQCFEIHHTPYI